MSQLVGGDAEDAHDGTLGARAEGSPVSGNREVLDDALFLEDMMGAGHVVERPAAGKGGADRIRKRPGLHGATGARAERRFRRARQGGRAAVAGGSTSTSS